MNESVPDKQPEMSEQQFLELLMQFQDGTLSEEGVAELSEVIRRDPAKRRLFQQTQLRTAAIQDLFRMDAFAASSILESSSESAQTTATRSKTAVAQDKPRKTYLLAAVSAALLLTVGYLGWQNAQNVGHQPPQEHANRPAEEPSTPAVAEIHPQVVLEEEDQARFFGVTGMETGKSFVLEQDYLLQSGMVKLKFPTGATAIIEAPSIFRVANCDRLILNSGGCSIHAPPGAEGFEVLTPLTKVVDRGTRFYVKVQDNSETEVHVIEGAADLYPVEPEETEAVANIPSSAPQSHPLHLTNGQAVQVGGFVQGKLGQETDFDARRYRGSLPDRLVAYEATSTDRGTVKDLTNVSVQRQGKLHTYPAAELIPMEVVSFRGAAVAENNGNLCGGKQKPARPADWLEDLDLQTGLINFGGQGKPLPELPLVDGDRLDVENAPPGLGIRFRSPVINQAGPDVVLFEIQSFVNEPQGDRFHVYPVSDRPDLHPLTVTHFDLTLNSTSLRRVSPVWSHRYAEPIRRLEELHERDAPVVVDVGHMHFHVIGVGIDLSDLGYAEGDSVSELFFQHASPDENVKTDPVYIGGLPPLTDVN